MNKKKFFSAIISFFLHLFFIIVGSNFIISNFSKIGKKTFIEIEVASILPKLRKKEKKIEEKKIKKIKKEVLQTKKVETKKKILKNQQKKIINQKKIEPSNKTKIKTNKKKEKLKKVDARAIYKNSSQPSNVQPGIVLEMKGWEWDDCPNPIDETEEIGKIVFEIKVDSFGEILSIRTLERTVSIEVEQIYRESLENITFSRKKDYKKSVLDTISTGKVIFYIRYK